MSSRSPSPITRPVYARVRSKSCTAIDWFQGALYWSDVEASGSFIRSGSYRSVHHYGQVMDMRHDRVRTATPVVIHQDRPYADAPLSAEVGVVETPTSTAGRSAPPPTPVQDVSYAATSRGTVEDTVRVLLSGMHTRIDSAAESRCHRSERRTDAHKQALPLCRDTSWHFQPTHGS